MDDRVGAYINKHPSWQIQLETLRAILTSTALEETIKWGGPCYTIDGKNVIGLAAFKHHLGLWFYQGALLNDKDRVLVNAQEGRTKAMRQWRFTADEKIVKTKVLAYVREAVRNAKDGRSIAPVRGQPLLVPPELIGQFSQAPLLEKAFETLSKGKQREYADYVSEAKQEATRVRRVKKITPMILAGQGLNDKYR